MKTLIVTGGIATGKSTAIRLLMEEGGPRLRLFDCDAEAGRLLDGGRLKESLSAAFGPASVDAAGRADRLNACGVQVRPPVVEAQGDEAGTSTRRKARSAACR